MPEPFGDARIEELTYLAEVSRLGSKDEQLLPDGPRRQMIASLIDQQFLNDINIQWYPNESPNATRTDPDAPNLTILENRIRRERVNSLAQLLSGQYVRLVISHKGRVRLSELKQELQKDRIRDSFGLVWDGRHLETDFKIAALQEDVTLILMDMNGLKQVNDQHGHAAGDDAIKYLLLSALAVFDSAGSVYRIGGDELVVLVLATKRDKVDSLLTAMCRDLESAKIGAGQVAVTVSIGVKESLDRKADFQSEREAADSAMYKSKEFGKSVEVARSTVCFTGESPLFCPA